MQGCLDDDIRSEREGVIALNVVAESRNSAYFVVGHCTAIQSDSLNAAVTVFRAFYCQCSQCRTIWSLYLDQRRRYRHRQMGQTAVQSVHCSDMERSGYSVDSEGF